MPLQDEFVAALAPLGRAFERYAAIIGRSPVLVGGAAVAIYTDGAFSSGDFDVLAGLTAVFDQAMLAEGFRQEDRAGICASDFTTRITRSSGSSRCPDRCSTVCLMEGVRCASC